MAAVDHSQSAFPFLLAVEVEWDGSVQARYVRANNDVAIDTGAGSETFTALPRMEFESEKMHGGVAVASYAVKMTAGKSPFDLAVKEPFAPLTMHLYEVDKDTGNSTCIFVGRVGEVWEYVDGESDIAEIKVLGVKHFLRVRLGVLAANTCAWNYGDENCKDTPATDSATISAISGEKLTLTGLAAGSWDNGFVEFEGLRLRIRKEGASNELFLTEHPPAGWDGQVVTVTEGCLKDKSDCEAKGNDINFGGFGRRMPRNDPRLEDRA